MIASIDPDPDMRAGVDPSRLRLLALAGRRMTALADTHAGLLPGWHGRSRGWWCEEGEMPVTLLSLGVCDATGLVLGEQCAFFEMFETMPTAAQVVFVPDHPLVPATPLLLDQLQRTPAQFEAVAADLRGFFASSATPPTPDDLIFAGTMLSVMQRNPIRDGYNIFSANGLARLRTGRRRANVSCLRTEFNTAAPEAGPSRTHPASPPSGSGPCNPRLACQIVRTSSTHYRRHQARLRNPD